MVHAPLIGFLFDSGQDGIRGQLLHHRSCCILVSFAKSKMPKPGGLYPFGMVIAANVIFDAWS